MGIEVKRVNRSYGIWDGYNCTFVDPSAWCFDEGRVRQYLKDHPFPKDCEYSEEDCLMDLLNSEGALIIPCYWMRTAEFIAELIQACLRR